MVVCWYIGRVETNGVCVVICLRAFLIVFGGYFSAVYFDIVRPMLSLRVWVELQLLLALWSSPRMIFVFPCVVPKEDPCFERFLVIPVLDWASNPSGFLCRIWMWAKVLGVPWVTVMRDSRKVNSWEVSSYKSLRDLG